MHPAKGNALFVAIRVGSLEPAMGRTSSQEGRKRVLRLSSFYVVETPGGRDRLHLAWPTPKYKLHLLGRPGEHTHTVETIRDSATMKTKRMCFFRLYDSVLAANSKSRRRNSVKDVGTFGR